MDLSLVFVLTVVADLLILKIIPEHRRVARFACRSVFFALQTVLIVALIGSPLRPTFRPKDLPREFWLQILTCVWWVLAARVLVAVLALPAALRKTTIENLHSGRLSSLDCLRNILEMRLLHQNQSLSRKEESRCRPKSNAGRLVLEKATP